MKPKAASRRAASWQAQAQAFGQLDLFDIANGDDDSAAMDFLDRADNAVAHVSEAVHSVATANPTVAKMIEGHAEEVSVAMYLRAGGMPLDEVNAFVAESSENPSAVMAVLAIADSSEAADKAYQKARDEMGGHFAVPATGNAKATGDQQASAPGGLAAIRSARAAMVQRGRPGSEPAASAPQQTAVASAELDAAAQQAAADPASVADETVRARDAAQGSPKKAKRAKASSDVVQATAADEAEVDPAEAGEDLLAEEDAPLSEEPVYADQDPLSHDPIAAEERAALLAKKDHAHAMQSLLGRLRSDRYAPPTYEQTMDLGRRIQAGDESARAELIERNTRLLARIAGRFRHTGRTLDDLFQAGSFGLIRAAEMFKPEKGFTFSTYADAWIRSTISRYLAADEIIRTPTHVRDQEFAIRKRAREATNRGDTEAALALEAKADAMKGHRPTENNFVSTDASFGDGDDRTLQDLLDSEEIGLEQTLEAKKLVTWLLRASNGTMNELHGEVFQMRLGLHPDYENTAVSAIEIAEKFNISKETVRNWFDQALKEVRLNVIRWAKGEDNLPQNLFPLIRQMATGREGQTDNGEQAITTLRQLLASDELGLSDDREAEKLLNWILRASNGTMDEKHGEVLQMRLGLHPDYKDSPLTQGEIAEVLGVSKASVQKWLEHALQEVQENVIRWAKGEENLPQNFFPRIRSMAAARH